MELNDLKNSWENLNDQAKNQRNLRSEMIEEMTRTKYNSNIKKVAYPEIIGVGVCLIGVSFILLNFYRLNTILLQAIAIISILLLLTLSAISLISIRQLSMTRDVNKPYAETLKEFATKIIRFHKFQSINITLSYLLLVTMIVLLPKFFRGNDISESKYFWIFSFSVGYIFLSLYSRWVSKYYKDKLSQAEELLKELSDFRMVVNL